MGKKAKTNSFLSSMLFLCSLTMLYCNSGDQSKQVAKFEKDIPPRLTGLFNSIRPLRDSLKQDTIENGYDSLEIRIWFGLNYEQQLFVLKTKKGVWGAYLINFGPVLNKRLDSALYIKREVISKLPNTSWTELLSRLVNYKILTLPDESRLNGYQAGGDGLHLAFEISTKEMYRLFSYSNPGLNQGIPEAVNVTQILNLIQNEFDVKLLGSCPG